MRVHSCESFGAVDGPGVRFVAFLAGCPFRCVYCHNPDTWAGGGAGEEIAPGALLEKALRYRPYWGKEGGVTVSGGEPLLQAEEVAEFFRLAREAGATTCLDTAGGPYRAGDVWQERALELSGTVLLDLKAHGEELHRKVAGCGNGPVLEFARAAARMGKDIWIRRVVVPGLTDGEEDLRKTAEFVRSLGGCVRRVEALAYHSMGEAKWKALGMEYPLAGARAPTEEEMACARALLAVDGVPVF